LNLDGLHRHCELHRIACSATTPAVVSPARFIEGMFVTVVGSPVAAGAERDLRAARIRDTRGNRSLEAISLKRGMSTAVGKIETRSLSTGTHPRSAGSRRRGFRRSLPPHLEFRWPRAATASDFDHLHPGVAGVRPTRVSRARENPSPLPVTFTAARAAEGDSARLAPPGAWAARAPAGWWKDSFERAA
jgi:hypothetical protein